MYLIDVIMVFAMWWLVCRSDMYIVHMHARDRLLLCGLNIELGTYFMKIGDKTFF